MASLRVDARLESLSAIGAFVLQAAGDAGIDARAAYRLRLAVDEIATNIVVHGRPAEYGGGTIIDVDAVVDGDRLTVALEDRGPAFDPLAHDGPDEADLSRPLDERPIGGLGVFLAIRGVDEFRYERTPTGNRNVFMVKRPSPPPASPA